MVYWLACLLLDPRFAGSNSTDDDGFLMATKIRSTTSVGGEIKTLVPCRKMLRHVKEPYSIKETLYRQNSFTISRQVSPASILEVSAGNCQRALVDDLRMTRTQIVDTQ
jgi:hypothetical protein